MENNAWKVLKQQNSEGDRCHSAEKILPTIIIKILQGESVVEAFF